MTSLPRSMSMFFAVALLLSTPFAPTALGQNWQVHQSPVVTVPQYVPKYPLTNPNANAASPQPKNTSPKSTHKPSNIKSKAPLTKKTTTTPKSTAKPKTSKPNSRKSSSNKKGKKETDKEKARKKETPPHYGVDYTIYRDQNLYPIDPRKPNNVCVRPCGEANCGCARKCNGCGGGLPGVGGRPYMEHEPGGCTCQKKKPTKHPQFNLHWPRPFSARLDERFPDHASERYQPCQKHRIVDMFDHLSTFKLSSYKRTDNAYSGEGADPYGCLGESKQLSRVAGVGYRFPSEPVDRGLGGGLSDVGDRFKASFKGAISRFAVQPTSFKPLMR